MRATKGIKVLFIAGFGPIDRNVAKSRKLYSDALGIAFKEDSEGYLYTGDLAGAKHFALWPLALAAQSCFGKNSWPAKIPAPQRGSNSKWKTWQRPRPISKRKAIEC